MTNLYILSLPRHSMLTAIAGQIFYFSRSFRSVWWPILLHFKREIRIMGCNSREEDTTCRAHRRFILFRFKRSPSREKTISAHELPEHRVSQGDDSCLGLTWMHVKKGGGCCRQSFFYYVWLRRTTRHDWIIGANPVKMWYSSYHREIPSISPLV